MTNFDPGEGWREIEWDQWPKSGQEFLHWAAGIDGPFRRWVHDQPLPPLPTDPGAIIRLGDGAYLPQIAQLDGGDLKLGWRTDASANCGRWVTVAELEALIGTARWERLELRRETARALHQVMRDPMRVHLDWVDEQFHEFGVES